MTKIRIKVNETEHQTITRTVFTDLTPEEIAEKSPSSQIEVYRNEDKSLFRSSRIPVSIIDHVFEEEQETFHTNELETLTEEENE